MRASELSYEAAVALVAEFAERLAQASHPTESLPFSAARGRILAQPLIADRDQPPFARATRDGFACRAAEAGNWLPILGLTPAGQPPAALLPPRAAWEIMNGAALPPGADAVLSYDQAETSGDPAKRKIRLLENYKIRPGKNLVAAGEQAHTGQQLLSAGTKLGALQIALASACGAAALHVFARPRVAILTTGDELVPPETEPAAGQIRNSNAPMLAAMVDAAGGDPWILPPAADHPEALDAALASVLAAAPTADLLLVSGGLSSGKFDLVQPALARAGARLHFSGVRMQPGRPTVFGELPSQSRSLPFVAAAGNPVSAAVAFAAFVAPLLAALAGRSECTPHFALARLAQATEKHTKPGLTRFLPARCSFTAEAALPWVDLIPSNGSGDLVALAQSNCFVLAPPSAQRIKKGATVRIVRST